MDAINGIKTVVFIVIWFVYSKLKWTRECFANHVKVPRQNLGVNLGNALNVEAEAVSLVTMELEKGVRNAMGQVVLSDSRASNYKHSYLLIYFVL